MKASGAGRAVPRSVAIIGGGPAGAQCARRLAEAGLAATLFEPRIAFEKPCGGGVPARAMARFPFLLDPRLPVKAIGTCALVAPSGRETELPLPDPLYVFSRADLHTHLIDRALAAGARLERARVLSYSREGAGVGRGGADGWRLRTAGAVHGPFDYLVGADGASGGVGRRLAGGPRQGGLTQGIGYYVPGLVEERITLKFYEGLHGYLWVFPRGDHASAGICGTLGERPVADLRALMDRWLAERYGPGIPERSERYAALIPGALPGTGQAPLQGDGWALVGDATRLVDPLTREGIYYAMLSGEMLADALARGRPGEYAAAWRSRQSEELAWAGRHAEGFFDRRFSERLVALCAASPRLARVLADLISGRQPYRGLKRRLLLAAPLVAVEALLRLRRVRGRRSTDRSGDGCGPADASRPGHGTQGTPPARRSSRDRRRPESAAGGA